jgi:hypothetical protein
MTNVAKGSLYRTPCKFGTVAMLTFAPEENYVR